MQSRRRNVRSHVLREVKEISVALPGAVLWITLSSVLWGCGTLPTGRGWGEDATLRPGWARVRDSAASAARDPWVWAPLAGAAMFQIDDWDRRAADWAREHTPVFGSPGHAKTWSDDLRTASVVAHYASILATPSGDEAGDWIVNKAQGAIVDAAAVSATVAVTRLLKTNVDRRRPNDAADESFPSGHTSSAAVHTRLASRNLRAIQSAGALSAGSRNALDVGLYALTIGTSWARIEAGWHYPADTLFGMALGNFLASFVNDAFLGLDTAHTSIAFSTAGDGATLQWRHAFR